MPETEAGSHTTVPTASSEAPVVTFYSYKGGVGRSMALANLAVIAARDYSLNVIVVDWDLEAPGLHRYFGIADKDVRDGVIDFIHRYRNLLLPDDKARPIRHDDLLLERSLVTVRTFKNSSGGLSTVRLLPAGSQTDLSEYSRKVHSINWDRFYAELNGAQLIEAIRKQLKGAADLVLLDSRTGYTDIGGICTLHMPDTVVVMFVFNDQNLTGTERVAKQLSDQNEIFEALGRRPEILFLPSRKEISEIERLRDWERRAATRLKPYKQSARAERKYPELLEYMRKVATPYIPYFAFGEELAAETEKGIELVEAYQNLATLIVGKEPLTKLKRGPLEASKSVRDSLSEALAAADLSDHQRTTLKTNWLDRYGTTAARASLMQWRYLAMRISSVVGAMAVPILLNPKVTGSVWGVIPALLVSVLVAMCVVLQQVLRPADYAREFRRVAELLRVEGLQFLQMTGRYSGFAVHGDAYQAFMARLEEIAEPRVEERTQPEPLDDSVLKSLGNLDLHPIQQEFLRSRWYTQLEKTRSTAIKASQNARVLALFLNTLSFAVPVLVSSLLVPYFAYSYRDQIVLGALVVSILLAIGLASQDLLQFDRTWLRDQRVSMALEREGWQFIQSSGLYRGVELSHALAMFNERIESILHGEERLEATLSRGDARW